MSYGAGVSRSIALSFLCAHCRFSSSVLYAYPYAVARSQAATPTSVARKVNNNLP